MIHFVSDDNITGNLPLYLVILLGVLPLLLTVCIVAAIVSYRKKRRKTPPNTNGADDIQIGKEATITKLSEDTTKDTQPEKEHASSSPKVFQTKTATKPLKEQNIHLSEPQSSSTEKLNPNISSQKLLSQDNAEGKEQTNLSNTSTNPKVWGKAELRRRSYI